MISASLPYPGSDDDEPVMWDRHIDVLEIVLSRPFNDGRVMHQGRDYSIEDSRVCLTVGGKISP